MSTRQNKKRKGRGNVINRERTVTTLTEGSEGSFMPSEDSHASLMSSPFSVASSATNASTISPSFSIAPSFPPFSFGYMSSMSNGTQGPLFDPQLSSADYYANSGPNDVEILERLKDTIKSNQHNFFRPLPQPQLLSRTWLGYHQSSVPPHPEQIPQDPYGRSDADAIGRRRDEPPSETLSSSGQVGSGVDSTNKAMDIEPPGLTLGSQLATSPTLRSLGQGVNRSATEKSLGDPQYGSKSSGELSSARSPLDSRGSRDTSWLHRNNTGTQDEPRGRYDADRNGVNGRPASDSRYVTDRPGQRYPRDVDREKDRDRERDRDRDWERDRDRRGTDFSTRYARDDRRDDKPRYSDTRRPPPDERHYEPRLDSSRTGPPPRHWDSKSDHNMSPPPRALDDHGPRPLGADRSPESRPHRPDDRPLDTRAARPLGEERSFESRLSRPVEERSLDSRLSRPLPDERSFNARTDPRDARDRQSRPPGDDRRPLPPLSDDKVTKPVDDRRFPPPSDRSARPGDARPTPSTGDTPSRPPPSMDRAPPPSPLSRSAAISAVSSGPRPVDDRRPPPPPQADRGRQAPVDRSGQAPARPSDERRPPEDYPPRPAAAATTPATDTSSTARPPAASRPPPPDDRPARQPSLQDRLSARPVDPPPAPRPDDRSPRSAPDTRPGNRAVSRPPADSTTRPADSRPSTDIRPASSLPERLSRPEERGRPVTNDRFARTSPPPRDRSSGPISSGAPPPRYSFAKGRPPSPVRDAPTREFKPRGGTVSPRRGDFRPSDRPPFLDRYERDRSRDRRSDTMDVDNPRFADRPPPANYRRASPPPFNRDSYVNNDPVRRDAPPPPHTYSRDWREDERAPPPNAPYDEWAGARRDWDRRPTLDREREFERDRFPDRDWETREERERRVSSTFPPPASTLPPPGDVPPARPFDSRPLSARLTDGYPPEDRDRDRPYERARYPPPPLDASPAPYNRVRQRSPTPPRRTGGLLEDTRPPLKRARDDAYGPGYYSPPGALDPPPPRDYPPPPSRLRSPPPPGPPGYYDDARDYPPRGVSPAGSLRDRERDYMDRDGYPPYDRRDPPPLSMGRMAPPRSPPPYARPAYGRDDRRYPPRA